jgi:hypothetical protein
MELHLESKIVTKVDVKDAMVWELVELVSILVIVSTLRKTLSLRLVVRKPMVLPFM